MKKKILITLVIILAAIQFIRPEKNLSEGVSENDISLAYQTPDEVVTSYEPGRQYHKLEEIKEMIDEDEMPLGSYTLIHTDAKLTETEKNALLGWAQTIRDTMKAKYPPEALAPKKPKPE